MSNPFDGLVGVLEETGTECTDNYTKLGIVMDTENHNNHDHESGWTGTSVQSFLEDGFVLGSSLQFCIVDISYFERLKNVEYALLRLTYDFPDKVSLFYLRQDLEDDDNQNWVYELTMPSQGGIIHPIYARHSSYGETFYPGGSNEILYFGRNFGLHFLYYPKGVTWGAGSFPSLPFIGKEYGVFGNFGAHHGMVWMDDEDTDNTNQRGVFMYNDVTNSYPTNHVFNTNVNGIGSCIYQDVNTEYHLSKAF